MCGGAANESLLWWFPGDECPDQLWTQTYVHRRADCSAQNRHRRTLHFFGKPLHVYNYYSTYGSPYLYYAFVGQLVLEDDQILPRHFLQQVVEVSDMKTMVSAADI